jgi:N-acetylglucosamine-6-sulfatase
MAGFSPQLKAGRRLAKRLAAAACCASIAACAAAGGGGLAQGAGTGASANHGRPNVVVIETDDQTQEAMKVMATVERRIAAKGVTFRNSFVNFSLCCPSRATFLTGQYAHNHHVLGNAPPAGGYITFEQLHADNNLAVWLQDAGYRTAMIGKYLNGYYMDPIEPPGWSEWDAGIGAKIYDYDMNENGDVVHYGTATSDYKQSVFTEKALRFINQSAPSSKPFFLWLTYSSPHTNGPDPSPQPPSNCGGAAKPAPRDAGAFASEPLPMAPNFNEADVSDKPEDIRSLPLLTAPDIHDMARKYRCALESLLSVDRGVGRVLDALRAQGELRNTYVVYTSDNGFFNGAHRIRYGKIKPYEESIRVPLVIRGPGLPRGRTARDLAINADLAPTITELTGARPGLTMDGRSLLPAARQPSLERGRELSVESTSFHAIRTERYIYARYRNGERELYDLARDPYELQNVVHEPAYHAVRFKLSHELGKLRDCRGHNCRLEPRVSLQLRHRSRREGGHWCALEPIRARIVGVQADDAVEAKFHLGSRLVADDRRPPLMQVLTGAHGRVRARAEVTMLDGRRLTIARPLRACR